MATPVLRHYANIERALEVVKSQPNLYNKKELEGEQTAAQYLGGTADPIHCNCGSEYSRPEPVPPETVPDPPICPDCNFRAPMPGDYRMVKGWGGGGAGIDQIWVHPANWDYKTNVPPEEVWIVEAKGGKLESAQSS